VVGTVGRLSQQKAPKRFIEIAERTLEKFHNVEFRWIGDGELRPEIEQMIQSKHLTEKVQITGWLDNVEKALLELDVFLLSSDYEALSYTPMEAMRAGLPCVLSNVTGSSDLVKEGETGFIVFPSDIDGYVASILQLLSDQELHKKMGQAGCKRWKEKFHLSSMVRRTAHLYQDLLFTYSDKVAT
jgi:glycosyltransferase involved in cell wall biosynthesis